eukprot:TRINITY_DN2927_c0_g2_i10.p1 TRINITY_DN2927_c0_g2~~TRINITY_DN2927_c0_g2_i10.p1  ORF type:complete len:435 (-),score=115.76 TRINITY_DN2927_c0_g2_i10:656-1891(-)
MRKDCLSEVDKLREKADGNEMVRKYVKGKFLGKGGFARCYEFLEAATGNPFAAKIISKSSLSKKHSKQKLISEINIHKSLNHPRIVKFKTSFEDAQNIYIILELCPNKTLKELLKRRKTLTEIEARCYLGQIIPALEYLHNNNIIHRDIKLGNLFLGKDMEVKIGDFGLAARIAEGEKRKTICGTPNYIAPEVLDSKVGHSYEADIWSIGILLYALLVGKPPFKAESSKETYAKIKEGVYTFPKDIPLSREAKDLITKLLTQDAHQRPTLDQILEHEFINGYGLPTLMPVSTLICPPSESFCRKYLETPSTSSNEGTTLEDTAPKPLAQPAVKPPEEIKSETVSVAKAEAIVKAEVARHSANRTSETWIARWLDYSSKYGLGFVTTNGCVGVHFNDNSKIVLHRNKRYAGV